MTVRDAGVGQDTIFCGLPDRFAGSEYVTKPEGHARTLGRSAPTICLSCLGYLERIGVSQPHLTPMNPPPTIDIAYQL